MQNNMTLEDILAQLDTPVEAGTTKTASTNNTTASLVDSLKALNSGLEKTASTAGDPMADLQKLANQVTSTNDLAMRKQAQILGTVISDAMHARTQQWNAAVNTVAKTASEDSFEKFAAENEELVKHAVELGYRDGINAYKQAQEQDFTQGYQKGEEALFKQAALEVCNGALCADQLLNALAEQA